MRGLTKDYWRRFQTADGKFDGVRFEDMVAGLLPKLFPGEWQRTQYSWDGKKDFFQQHGGVRRWAECKAYRNSISINVLSPTLVMALIDDAQVIIFFSYSPLNDNARWYLAQFAHQTSRTIYVYDDKILEKAICEHLDIGESFRRADTAHEPGPREISVSVRLSQDPDVEHRAASALEDSARDFHIAVLSTFCLDVLVQNEWSDSAGVAGHLALQAADMHEHFWLLNRDISDLDYRVPFNLQPGQSFFQRFHLRARHAGRLPPPRITALFDGDKDARSLLLPRIDVSALLAVPLIGERQHRALNSFRHLVDRRDQPIFCHVYGASGTGKTRLIREFRDELLGHGFTVFTFNGEDELNSSFDQVVRRLVSAITKLPLLEQVNAPEDLRPAPHGDAANGPLLDLLYGRHAKPSDNPEPSARIVLQLILDRKVALVVDNIQYFDAATIFLFNLAVTETAGASARNAWIFGLNTDLSSSELPATKLSSRLLSLAAETPQTVLAVHVEGFTETDARLYLDQALGSPPANADASFTQTYPETTRRILELVGPQPLFLEQTLRFAEDRGCLALHLGRLQVIEPDLFHAVLQGLPRKIETLIERRWEVLRPRLTVAEVDLVESVAQLICLPATLAQKLDASWDNIQHLVRLGVLKLTESNEVGFHHRQHYLYFSAHYREVRPTLARRLLTALEDGGYAAAYPLQCAVLRDSVDALGSAETRAIASLVVARTVVGAALQHTASRLLQIFNRPASGLDAATELRAVTAVCEDLKRYSSFDVAADAFARASNARAAREARYHVAGEAYHEFVRGHANSFFALHRDHEVHELLFRTLQEMGRFRFASERGRAAARGALLNRLCVSAKTIHDLRHAEECARESLDIAERIGDVQLAYKSYIDWGYVYHGFGVDNSRLQEKWTAALAIFDRARAAGAELQEEKTSAQLHRGALLVLDRKYDEARACVDDGIAMARRAMSPFHEVKLLLLRTVIELTANSNPSVATLHRWVDMAEDRSIVARANRSFWAVFYTRAKVHQAQGNDAAAAECLRQALRQLLRLLPDPRMEERHEPFFEDVAVQLRRLGSPLNPEAFALLRNGRIRARVAGITNLPPDSFASWLRDYRPTATFHDGRYNLPVP